MKRATPSLLIELYRIEMLVDKYQSNCDRLLIELYRIEMDIRFYAGS